MTAIEADRQAQWAAALLDPTAACPDGLVVWNGSDPGARLAVHRNNVIASLVGALADSFPVVRALVGDEFFRAMAAQAVRALPPRSRVLADYGAELPAFIEQFEPARGLPYLADVARLECARARAWHSADAPPMSHDDLQGLLAHADRLAGATLELHPSITVLRSAHAVVSIWLAHQGVGELGAIDIGRAEAALVLREGLEVAVLNLTPGAARFADALLAGRTIEEASDSAAATHAHFDLADALGLLIRHDAITQVRLGPERSRRDSS